MTRSDAIGALADHAKFGHPNGLVAALDAIVDKHRMTVGNDEERLTGVIVDTLLVLFDEDIRQVFSVEGRI